MSDLKVLLFAELSDHFGAAEVELGLRAGATAGDLIRELVARKPEAEGLLSVSRVAVDYEFISTDAILPLAAEIAVIPPVSGG